MENNWIHTFPNGAMGITNSFDQDFNLSHHVHFRKFKRFVFSSKKITCCDWILNKVPLKYSWLEYDKLTLNLHFSSFSPLWPIFVVKKQIFRVTQIENPCDRKYILFIKTKYCWEYKSWIITTLLLVSVYQLNFETLVQLDLCLWIFPGYD